MSAAIGGRERTSERQRERGRESGEFIGERERGMGGGWGLPRYEPGVVK